MNIIQLISKNERRGLSTSIGQVKQALNEFAEVDFDSLTVEEQLQLSDALTVCGQNIGMNAYSKRKRPDLESINVSNVVSDKFKI